MHCFTYQNMTEFKACSFYMINIGNKFVDISICIKLRKFIDYMIIVFFSSDRDHKLIVTFINQILKNIVTFL